MPSTFIVTTLTPEYKYLQMSSTQHVVTLAKNILQPQDNNLRAESQKILNSAAETNPSELALALINILRSEESQEVKSFAITQLRKNLSAFSQAKFENIWPKITPENQEFIRTSLFECLHKEKFPHVRNLIADAIGQIAGSIMSVNANNWPKFVDCVYVLLNDSSNESIISSLVILENFFSYCPEVFAQKVDELYVVFKNAFGHENNKIKSAGIKAFYGFVISADKKALSKLETLIIPMYQIAYHLLVNDKENTEGLETISDLIEIEPKILKKTFNEVNDLMHSVIKLKDVSPSVKRMGTECLISLAERYPALYRQHKEKLTQLIEMVFYHMVEIDSEIDEVWKSPPEGYSQDVEEGEDFETTTFGMTSVDRLIASVGQKEMLPLLSVTVQKMLTMNDWRYKYASIMALSQTGQYIEDATSIKSIVDMLLVFLGDENPMIRFSSCHALGQISDDMQPHFQQLYGKDSFLKLASLLKDPVPRVVSHAASALTNLIEGMKYEDVAEYMPELISTLLHLSTTGISLLKQSVLTTIASISEVAKSNYVPFFQKTTEVLIQILQNHPGKQYKELKGLVIEAFTSIAEGVGKEVFKPVAPTLIEYLIKLQDSQLEQVDPQKQYVLGGWQRLCVVFGTDLSSYLPRILPGLFNLVQGIIQSNVKNSSPENFVVKDDQNDQFKINTYETEEAEIAIAMLNVFIKEMKEYYVPYVQRTIKIMVAIVKSMVNESVKQQALTSLPLLINLIKTNNLQAGIAYTKTFLGVLAEACLQEYDTDLLICELECMKQIFEMFQTKFLSAEELTAFNQKVIKILLKSDQRKNDTKTLSSEQLEEEEKELLNDQIGLEEDVQVAISELIGKIFMTHKEMTLGLVEYIIKNILPRVFTDGLSENMYKFGIFLIDDMIQYLGYGILKEVWGDFYNIFSKFSLSKNLSVRQASCYGLGIYAQNTPTDIFKPLIEKSLQVLHQAAEIPKGAEAQKAYGACKDNAISAFGKIIKAHGSSFDPQPVLHVWLNYLPLKSDKPEAHLQHEFLTDVMINSPALLIQESQKGADATLKILQIFGDIIQTKLITPEITQKIKLALGKLKTLPSFVANYDMYWSKLSEMQTVKLTMLVKEA